MVYQLSLFTSDEIAKNWGIAFWTHPNGDTLPENKQNYHMCPTAGRADKGIMAWTNQDGVDMG